MGAGLPKLCRKCLRIGPWVNECCDCLDKERAARMGVWGYMGEDEDYPQVPCKGFEPIRYRRQRERENRYAMLHGDGCMPVIDVMMYHGVDVVAAVDRILAGHVCLSGAQSPLQLTRRGRIFASDNVRLEQPVRAVGSPGLQDA